MAARASALNGGHGPMRGPPNRVFTQTMREPYMLYLVLYSYALPVPEARRRPDIDGHVDRSRRPDGHVHVDLSHIFITSF